MKIVDKYELAKCPYGTIFYEYEPCYIKRGPLILASDIFVEYDEKPFFNGVFECKPDLECIIETDNFIQSKAKWYSVDTDSNDYSDDDKFIILDKEEALELIEIMKKMVEGEI